MNNCPHYDYGKSADKALGAYCTAKKKLVEPEDCEGCDKTNPIGLSYHYRDGKIRQAVVGEPNFKDYENNTR